MMKRVTTLTISEARRALSGYAEDVASKGERICVVRNGKPKFGMVGIADLKLLEVIEPWLSNQVALRVFKKGKFIPWKKAKERLPKY